MPRQSAGVLLFRSGDAGLEVLLCHPGGPFWANRDEGAWSIPKGELEPGQDPLAVARREFAEELGTELAVIDEELIDLGEVRQKGGKVIRAWAAEGELDAAAIESNSFEIEWPPRSGRRASFPEVDRAAWLEADLAREKINPAQAALIDRLVDRLAA